MIFSNPSMNLIPPSQLFKQVLQFNQPRATLIAKHLPPIAIPQASTFVYKMPQTAQAMPQLSFVDKPSSTQKLSGLPPRSAQALTGTAFLEQSRKLSRPEREKAILQQVLSGNVPDFMREFKPLSLSAKGADGQMHTATVHVMPDYLAIGSNEDFVNIPMDPMTAQKIADQTGTVLPTRKLVNDIYKQAQVKLQPKPQTPGPQMMSNDYYLKHAQTLKQQRQDAGMQLGQLLAGHKKDVVLTNRLESNPGKVAIYGWHQLNGKAIQPLSTIHENTYADYSHGVRLVAGTMTIDGVELSVAEVLKNPNLAPLLSDEGALKNSRIRL